MSFKSVGLFVSVFAILQLSITLARPTEKTTVDNSETEKLTVLKEAIKNNLEAYDGFLQGFNEETADDIKGDPSLEKLFAVFNPFNKLPNEAVTNIKKHLNEFGNKIETQVKNGEKIPDTDQLVSEYLKIVESDIQSSIKKFSDQMETDSFFGSLKNARNKLVSIVQKVSSAVVDMFKYLFKSTYEHPKEWEKIDEAVEDDGSNDFKTLQVQLKRLIEKPETSEASKKVAGEMLQMLKDFEDKINKAMNPLVDVYVAIIEKQAHDD